jgi:hypothetical protein
LCARKRLSLRAIAIAARVEGDPLVTAGIALFDMATECGNYEIYRYVIMSVACCSRLWRAADVRAHPLACHACALGGNASKYERDFMENF